MKRFLAPAIAFGMISGLGLVGCSDEAKVTQKETVTTPGGTTSTETTKKIDSSGSNPPANSEGEKAK